MRARDGNELSPIQVFDSGCAESRVRELTGHIIEEYVEADLKRHAKEYLRNFEPVPPYPLNNAQILEKFGSIARQEALKILEQEKKNIVDFQSPYIKKVLQTYLKQLKFVLFDDQKPFKRYEEEVWKPDSNGENPRKTVVSYTRSEIIHRWTARLTDFSDFRPYLNDELSALWKEADALASQENLVSKQRLKQIAQEASKTEKEVQEATRAL